MPPLADLALWALAAIPPPAEVPPGDEGPGDGALAADDSTAAASPEDEPRPEPPPESALAILARAQQLRDAREHARALDVVAEAIARDPDLTAAYLLSAQLRMDLAGYPARSRPPEGELGASQWAGHLRAAAGDLDLALERMHPGEPGRDRLVEIRDDLLRAANGIVRRERPPKIDESVMPQPARLPTPERGPRPVAASIIIGLGAAASLTAVGLGAVSIDAEEASPPRYRAVPGPFAAALATGMVGTTLVTTGAAMLVAHHERTNPLPRRNRLIAGGVLAGLGAATVVAGSSLVAAGRTRTGEATPSDIETLDRASALGRAGVSLLVLAPALLGSGIAVVSSRDGTRPRAWTPVPGPAWGLAFLRVF